jgi:hypothetical protein
VPLIVRATVLGPDGVSFEPVELHFGPTGVGITVGLTPADGAGAPEPDEVPWSEVESLALGEWTEDAAEGHGRFRRRAQAAGADCLLHIGIRGHTPRAFRVASIAPSQLSAYLAPVFEWLERPRVRAA